MLLVKALWIDVVPTAKSIPYFNGPSAANIYIV